VVELRTVAPEVESRFEAAVGVALARVAVVEDLAEAVVPAVEVLEPSVEGLVLVVPAVAVVGFRAVPVVPTEVRFSAVLPGLDDASVLVLLAAVEERVDFLSSSLALTLGRLRWLEVVDVAVVGRRAAAVVDETGGRVGGLLSPPGARAPAVAPAADRDDEVVVPATAVRRAVVVVAVGPALLADGEADVALTLDGVSGDKGVDSLDDGAPSERWATSMFSLSAIFNDSIGVGLMYKTFQELQNGPRPG
jgi:hypothetical protein